MDHAAQLATVIEVTATPVTHDPDPLGMDQDPAPATPDQITARYTGLTPAAALTAFAAAHPDVTASITHANGQWTLTAVTPGAAPTPVRRQMNWEHDGDAEASDGWLSNLAAAANNLDNSLRHEPRYCTHPTRVVPCPDCRAALERHTGRWGPYYQCACGWKAGCDTRKARAARAQTRITAWCGTPLEPRVNHLGVPYAGCPTCDPAYASPTLRDLYA